MFDGIRNDRIILGDLPGSDATSMMKNRDGSSNSNSNNVKRRTIISFYHSPHSVIFLLSSGDVYLIPNTQTPEVMVYFLGQAPQGTQKVLMSNNARLIFFQTQAQTSVHVVINNLTISQPLAVIDTLKSIVSVSPTGLILVSPNGIKNLQLITSQNNFSSGNSGSHGQIHPSTFIDKADVHSLRPTVRLIKTVPLSGVSSGSFAVQYDSRMFNGTYFPSQYKIEETTVGQVVGSTGNCVGKGEKSPNTRGVGGIDPMGIGRQHTATNGFEPGVINEKTRHTGRSHAKQKGGGSTRIGSTSSLATNSSNISNNNSNPTKCLDDLQNEGIDQQQQIAMPIIYSAGCRDGKIYLIQNNFETIVKLGDVKTSISNIYSSILPLGDFNSYIPESALIGVVTNTGTLSFFSNVPTSGNTHDSKTNHSVSRKFKVSPDVFISSRNDIIIVTNKTGEETSTDNNPVQTDGGRKTKAVRTRRNNGISSSSQSELFSTLGKQQRHKRTSQSEKGSNNSLVSEVNNDPPSPQATISPVQVFSIKVDIDNQLNRTNGVSSVHNPHVGLGHQRIKSRHGFPNATNPSGVGAGNKEGVMNPTAQVTSGGSIGNGVSSDVNTYFIKNISVKLEYELSNPEMNIPSDEKVQGMFSIDIHPNFTFKIASLNDESQRDTHQAPTMSTNKRNEDGEPNGTKENSAVGVESAFMIVTDCSVYVMRNIEMRQGTEEHVAVPISTGLSNDVLTPRFECLKAFCVSLHKDNGQNNSDENGANAKADSSATQRAENGTQRQHGRSKMATNAVKDNSESLNDKGRQGSSNPANQDGSPKQEKPREDRNRRVRRVKTKARGEGNQRHFADADEAELPNPQTVPLKISEYPQGTKNPPNGGQGGDQVELSLGEKNRNPSRTSRAGGQQGRERRHHRRTGGANGASPQNEVYMNGGGTQSRNGIQLPPI